MLVVVVGVVLGGAGRRERDMGIFLSTHGSWGVGKVGGGRGGSRCDAFFFLIWHKETNCREGSGVV